MEQETNILIVDDSKPFCKTLKEIIEDSGCAAWTALNGREAIEQQKKNSYDLAFVDIKLPDMSGHDVVNEMTKLCPKTEYIYVTGHSSVNSAIEAVRQEKVLSYETKPLDPDRVLLTIKQFRDRRHMENRLRDAELEIHMLSHAVEQSPVTVVITNTAGKVEYVNSKFTQLTGYTSEEAIGKNPRILKSGNTPKEVYENLWKKITSGKEWHGEFCNKKKNGDLYYELTHISPMKDKDGYIVRYIAIKEDITSRKKMEEALIQSEKLKSLGTITAGISHEFNNILNIISGKTQLIEMGYNNDMHLRGELSTIMKAIDGGVAITDRMLEITKPSNIISELELFDINTLLKQSIEFTMPRWKNMAQANGIDYFIEKKGMEDIPQLLCKPTELRDVFISIINNALDAMPDGGTITVTTRCVRPLAGMNKLRVQSKNLEVPELKSQNALPIRQDSEHKYDLIEIAITDTGNGMTTETMHHIFDPFFTTRCPERTGLGMSIAFGTITRHGGRIEVESELGKGSKITLTFPTANKNAETIETPKQETNKKSLHILVADDEEDICYILDKFLSRSGHKVKTVNDGFDAIELIKHESFDLVLCDLAMPNVYGFDVANAVNNLEKRPRFGIITGWNGKIENVGSKEFKVDFLIRKPFKFSELTKQMNIALDADN